MAFYKQITAIKHGLPGRIILNGTMIDSGETETNLPIIGLGDVVPYLIGAVAAEQEGDSLPNLVGKAAASLAIKVREAEANATRAGCVLVCHTAAGTLRLEFPSESLPNVVRRLQGTADE